MSYGPTVSEIHGRTEHLLGSSPSGYSVRGDGETREVVMSRRDTAALQVLSEALDALERCNEVARADHVQRHVKDGRAAVEALRAARDETGKQSLESSAVADSVAEVGVAPPWENEAQTFRAELRKLSPSYVTPGGLKHWPLVDQFNHLLAAVTGTQP